MPAANADLSRDIPRQLELFFGSTVANTLPHKGFLVGTVTVTTPSQGAANNTGTVNGTVTGVKVGDLVVSVAPTTALPANQLFTSAIVTAADTVTFVFDSITGATTGASRVFNYIISQRG